jgi:serine/threonine protein kinase
MGANALLHEEASRKTLFLLPVWHEVTRDEIARYSPILADRTAVSTAAGLDTIVASLVRIVRESSSTTDSDPLAEYEVLYSVHEGHYGRVLKCHKKKDGTLCIVKESATDRVDVAALERLTCVSVENLATPRKIWHSGVMTYEELPYVGGLRLSRAVIHDIGGLTGSILESCHDQLMRTLGQLHAYGIIHRDVHPENVFAVVDVGGKGDATPTASRTLPWRAYEFGPRGIGWPRFAKYDIVGRPFRVAWVLVDCTFASLSDSTSSLPFRHGTFTAPEQAEGRSELASDIYAFGATLYFGITGKELPAYRERIRTSLPTEFPHGGHSSREFPQHLRRLVALDTIDRPNAPTRIQCDTVTVGYTGTMLIGDNLFLLCDHFDSETVLVSRDQAVAYYKTRLHEITERKRRFDAQEYEHFSAMLKRFG